MEFAGMQTRIAPLFEARSAIWRDQQAGLISFAEARRRSAAVGQEPKASKRSAVGSRPRSADSLARRRRWVAAGMMPPQVACLFTQGQTAVLAVIAAEVKKRGRCELPIAAIAALAGVGRTTVQNALRAAENAGVLSVEERRLRWTRNDTNVVKIVSPEWTAWLRLPRREGSKARAASNTSLLSSQPFLPFGSGMAGKSARRVTRSSGGPDAEGSGLGTSSRIPYLVPDAIRRHHIFRNDDS